MPQRRRDEKGDAAAERFVKYDELYLCYLAEPAQPRQVGRLRLVDAGKGVSLQYGAEWLAAGFPLSEDLLFTDIEQLPRWKGMAVGAVDDARPDRWGERVIQYLFKPARLSLMEYLYYAGDERFGALGVSTSQAAYVPRTRSPLPRLEQAQRLSEVVHKVSARAPVNQLERQMLNAGGSFGGAKPKALIEIGAVQCIKFFDNDPSTHRIEHASKTLARLAGSSGRNAAGFPLAGEHALAVPFDRDGLKRILPPAEQRWGRASPDRNRWATRAWLSYCAAPVRRTRDPQPARHARAVSPYGVQHPHETPMTMEEPCASGH